MLDSFDTKENVKEGLRKTGIAAKKGTDDEC